MAISIEGRFDFNSRFSFEAACAELEHPCSEIVVDFSRLTYMDSSAMGLLLQLRDRVSGEPGRVILSNAPDSVRSQLYTAQFDKLFDIQ